MVDTTCPKCGKKDKSQLIGIQLKSRIDTFKCEHCGEEFVISGDADDEKKVKANKPPSSS
jgi:transcription elongation factor Elf1